MLNADTGPIYLKDAQLADRPPPHASELGAGRQWLGGLCGTSKLPGSCLSQGIQANESLLWSAGSVGASTALGPVLLV